VDGRDFSNDTYAPVYSLLRTRLGVEKSFGNARVFVEGQDSRTLGEEPTLKTAIDNIDLHQGYLEVEGALLDELTFRVGRFESAYGTQRFFGRSNWGNVGRSFDGLKLSFDFGARVDVFSYILRNQTSSGNNPNSAYPAQPSDDARLFGAWFHNSPQDAYWYDAFVYYESDNAKTNGADPDLRRATLGATWFERFDELSLVVEGAAQIGSVAGRDLTAYVVALKVSYAIDATTLAIGGERNSGTDPAELEEYNTYSNNLGTGNGLHGRMDYFSSKLAEQTRGLGLQDYNFTVKTKITPKMGAKIEARYLDADQASALGASHFGEEIDLTVKYGFSDAVTFGGGFGVFLPGDLMKEFYAASEPRDDAGFWGFVGVEAAID
jgi:hypothetical protein